ncbi:hypothetical protein FB106_11921 [Synechococcus sp. Ace-Pa]|nr:hypothetical protein BM449_00700 [Synechococcus sp. SynAce01]TWB87893.1 hypothetical protein FB106_11921 [Synechococcus sp. Ace-Pa]
MAGENVAIVRPRMLLIAWIVFVVAVGLKVWRLSLVLRRTLTPAMGLEQFRHSLERRWASNRQVS